MTGYESPYGLTNAGDELWYADGAANLVAVDARSGEVNGSVQLHGRFEEMAITEDVAWVVAGFVGSDAQLMAVDRSTVTVRGTALPQPPSYYGHVATSGGDVVGAWWRP